MNRNNDHEHFLVIGAGEIEMSQHDTVKCGGQLGFHFGVSWGKYRYTGGLLSRKDAKRLADFIYQKLKEPKRKKLNSEPNPEECDATDDHSTTKADKQNKNS